MVRNYGNCGNGNASYGSDLSLLRGRLAEDADRAVRPSDSCLVCERQGIACDGFHEEPEVADEVTAFETRDSIATSNREEQE